MTVHVTVVRPGPLTTIQDLGRWGHRAIGVSPSGAADRAAMARANALVGNAQTAAVLEVTFGGLAVAVDGRTTCALTGAACPGAPRETAFMLRAGATITLEGARAGIRAYLAFAGGVDAPPVLGSRSTDTLGGLGPAPLQRGDVLALGTTRTSGGRSTAPAPPLPEGSAALWLSRGPRDDWLDEEGWASLDRRNWVVSDASNRVAVRLSGTSLPIRAASLEPEPLVRGAVQVPPDGQPIVFLADHPVTGGYPVIGVLRPGSCDLAAQCRPGTVVRLRSPDLDDDGAAHPAG